MTPVLHSLAEVVIEEVDAYSTILARIRTTGWYNVFTSLPTEAWWTVTGKSGIQASTGIHTRGIVPARRHITQLKTLLKKNRYYLDFISNNGTT